MSVKELRDILSKHVRNGDGDKLACVLVGDFGLTVTVDDVVFEHEPGAQETVCTIYSNGKRPVWYGNGPTAETLDDRI